MVIHQHALPHPYHCVYLEIPRFNLDAGKAEAFLASIATVKADELIASKNIPKPEVFDMKNGTLEITVTVDGEKEPITLTVGGLDDAKKHYYAKSNKMPGQFFLLAKERFETYKSKPAAFFDAA